MKSWKDRFQTSILVRGQNYFDEGRVLALERTQAGCTAFVNGSEIYEVKIRLEGDCVKDMFCTCPYAEDGGYCKHMAAVLLAAENAPVPKEERLTPECLVEKIPDSQLRPLLTQLVSADEKLYRTLFLRYGGESLEACMETLKDERASIGRKYADRRGYINYRDTGGFSEEIAEYIRHQTEIILSRGGPLLAFQSGMDALREYADYERDDSNGDYALVLDEMEHMCQEVQTCADGEVVSKIFDLLAECVKSDQEDWLVRDFAERALFSQFEGRSFDRKRLALVDEQIAGLEASGKTGYAKEHKMQPLLEHRFALMEKLSSPPKELDAFLERYTSYTSVRKLRIQRLLDGGKTDDAICVLKEGKAAAQGRPGLAAEYSKRLMDLYEQLGERDKLLAELEYHVFTLCFGGMETLNRLKNACTPEQWIEYRERYLSQNNYHNLELLESEGLWARLLEAVTASNFLSTLDRYEKSLKNRYPDEMREAYARVLEQQAAAASSRTQYQELVDYLKKIKDYPGGAKHSAQLANDWRTRYSRRRAMMEELRNAGF